MSEGNIAPVQDKTATLNGLRYHYRDWGSEDAQPLILLHAYTQNCRIWDTVAEQLTDAYRILALDLPGHGETEWPVEYSCEQMADDIEAFRSQLQLSHFPLVGFSTGGHCSLLYAAQHPEVVDRLVMIEAQPEPPVSAFTWLRNYLDLPDEFDDQEAAVRAFGTIFHRAPERELRHWATNNLTERDDGRWVLRYDPRLRSANPPPGVRNESEVAWSTLPKLSCPTLVVRGAESEMLSRPNAERMVATIPDGRLVSISGAGHFVPLDNPEGFLDAVRKFVEGP